MARLHCADTQTTSCINLRAKLSPHPSCPTSAESESLEAHTATQHMRTHHFRYRTDIFLAVVRVGDLRRVELPDAFAQLRSNICACQKVDEWPWMPRCSFRGHWFRQNYNSGQKRTCHFPRRYILKPPYCKPRCPGRDVDVVLMRARAVHEKIGQRRVEEAHAVPLADNKRPEVRKRQINVRRFQSKKTTRCQTHLARPVQ